MYPDPAIPRAQVEAPDNTQGSQDMPFATEPTSQPGVVDPEAVLPGRAWWVQKAWVADDISAANRAVQVPKRMQAASTDLKQRVMRAAVEAHGRGDCEAELKALFQLD